MKKRETKKIIFETRLTENNRLLRDYVLKKLKKYKDLKSCEILEIGVGNGRFGFLMGNKFRKYYGIEPDEEYLEIAHNTKPSNKLAYRLGSAEKIPFKKKFDIVFYPFSWHFIENHKAAIKEAERVLKDDGIVIIIDPKEDSKGWLDKRMIKGTREFNKEMYNEKIKQLRTGMRDLKKQRILKIVQFESNIINLWILKKRK